MQPTCVRSSCEHRIVAVDCPDVERDAVIEHLMMIRTQRQDVVGVSIVWTLRNDVRPIQRDTADVLVVAVHRLTFSVPVLDDALHLVVSTATHAHTYHPCLLSAECATRRRFRNTHALNTTGLIAT